MASCVADTIDSPHTLFTEEINNALPNSLEKDDVSQDNILKGKDQDFPQQPHSKSKGNQRKLLKEKLRNRVPTPGPSPKHDSDDEQTAHESESELQLEFTQSCQDKTPNQISRRLLKSVSDHKFKFKVPFQKARKDGNSPETSKKMVPFKRKKQPSETSSITEQQEDIEDFSEDESTRPAEMIKEDPTGANDRGKEGKLKPAKAEEGKANGTGTLDEKQDEKGEKYREGKRWVDEGFFNTDGDDLGFRIWHD